MLTCLRPQDHARQTMCRIVRVDKINNMGPHFVDEHGNPDTLPAHAYDPITDYCQPYPHLTAALTRQTAWIPTYILRFIKTIPNNQSEVSRELLQLSEYDIVVLLYDGPFKSAQSSWIKKQKTDMEVKEMCTNSRRYARADRVSVCSCR